MWRIYLAIGLTMTAFGCGGADTTKKSSSHGKPAACTAAQVNNTQCSGTVLQKCDGTTWATVQNCTTTSQQCSELTATTAACVTPVPTTCTAAQTNFQRCNLNLLETCDGSTWALTQNCAATNLACVASGNSATCETPPLCADAATNEYLVCDGNQVVTCNGSTQSDSYDCMASGAECYDFPDAAPATAWCVVASGDACLSSEGYQLFCGSGGTPSASMRCDLDVGCTSGGSACSADGFEQTCLASNTLLVGCIAAGNISQQFVIDCAADGYQGTCPTGGTACVTTVSGAQCYPGVINCSGGLTCSGSNTWGTCN